MTVESTEQMFVVKTPDTGMFRSARTSTMSGAKANQHTKAMKKEDQAKWKARMWGRWKERSWISLALKPWVGSTGLYVALECCSTSEPLPDSREDMVFR